MGVAVYSVSDKILKRAAAAAYRINSNYMIDDINECIVCIPVRME